MRFVVRIVATVILGSFLLTPAFAEDAAKASSNSTAPEASAPNASTNSTAYLAPRVPMPPQAAPPAKTPAASSGEPHPLIDLFGGYSYQRFNANAGTPENLGWHGGTAALALNVNSWFSLVADFGVYHIKDPSTVSGTSYTYLFGPQFSYRTPRWTPFVHALFGAERLADIQVTPPTGSTFFNHSFSANGFATALGGGLDFNLNKRVGIRLFQAEYLMSHIADGHDNEQNNMRASTGLVLHFGGGPPPPPPNRPPTVTLSANPTKVFAGSGDAIVLQAQCTDPDNDT